MGIGPITQILSVNTSHVTILYKYRREPTRPSSSEDFESTVLDKQIPGDQWDEKYFSHFVDLNTDLASKSADAQIFIVTEKVADGLRLPPDGRENNHLVRTQSVLSELNAES